MNRLNLIKRCQIVALKESGVQQKIIAYALNVHKSTISRELKRNSGPVEYLAEEENKAAICRRRNSGNGKIKMRAALIELIEQKLKKDQ